ncbi:MAG: cell division protein FtsX [Alphaproteobacteria bacterium]
MMRLPFRSAPRLPPLAGGAAGWFAPWLIALMVYVASLAGIGLILVDETLRASENLLARRLTVQVPADASAARVETILAVLRQTPGIRSVHLLSPEETGRLLEPWLGSPVALGELPVPRLIDAGLDPAAALDMAMLRTQLGSVVPEIRLDDHRPVVSGLRTGALPLQALLGAAIGAALLLVAGSAVFATGAALASRLRDIELLHLVGADDRQIARSYAARSLLYGLIGGGIAAAAILATVAALGGTGRLIRVAAPAEGIGLGDWRLWAVLAAMTLAAGILAAASARATVRWRLASLP